MQEFFYKVIPKPHQRPPDFNFSIWLDSLFAEKLISQELPQKEFNLIQNRVNWVIYSCGLKTHEDYQPLNFINQDGKLTQLLESIKLPGGREWRASEGVWKLKSGELCFYYDGISRNPKDIDGKSVYYISENVKNVEQSHVLLMMWLEYIDELRYMRIRNSHQ